MLNNDYIAYSDKTIEDLELPENFNLKFTDEYSMDFIDLVERDDSEIEELDDIDMVYLNKAKV